jgi:beta-mannosidase
MNTINLNGTWSVRPQPVACIGEAGLAQALEAGGGWLPAVVPGEIHLDLIRAGKMAEPTVGANMPECRWPETQSWWHRTHFELSEGFLKHEGVSLVFDGLDLYAQVFLNGKLVGEAADAFVPVIYEVKPFLQEGQNELVVRLTAGSELARDATPSGQGKPWASNSAVDGSIPNPIQPGDPYGHRLWNGRRWLRKPQFTYGWDWVDALPNIGIWRGVRLEARSFAVLHDLRLDTLLQDGQVMLEMDAVVENLHPWSERPCLLELEITPPGSSQPLHRRYPVAAVPGRNRVQDTFPVPEARLWWPNGMGDQPLYHVTAKVTGTSGALQDQRQFSIGLRTIQIDRAPLPAGSRFLIKINGQEMFCRGANIGPHDPILARITDEKYMRLVEDARDAHMNMIRINGCSIFEAPAFYDACDRAGILIWHDFPLTDISYPDEDRDFVMAVRDEIETALPLLRHHPSIALWCGNNENTWFFVMNNPDLDRPLDIGGQKLYYQVLPDICAHLDPRRPYWPSSPCGGEHPNSELEGNCHWWFPFFMSPDINRRIRHEVFDECQARFVTEYGVIGPCHLDSIQEYLAPEEQQPGNFAWQLHTNMHEKETMAAAIRLHYTDPQPLGVPEYVLYGQLFQSLIHEHAMEALRFRKNDPADDCQGALIWSYSDCWGETGWSILDYYLRRKASYYGLRRACRPVKVIVRRRGDRLVTRLVNDTLQPVIATLEYGWHRLDGMHKVFDTRTVIAPPNSMLEIGEALLPSAVEKDPREWIYAAVLSENGQRVDQSIWTLAPHRELVLPEPVITAHALANGEVEVSSPVYCHAVHVEDHGRELISDNWFDLLPGVAHRVKLAEGCTLEGLPFQAVV